jgi:hypothetical protein
MQGNPVRDMEPARTFLSHHVLGTALFLHMQMMLRAPESKNAVMEHSKNVSELCCKGHVHSLSYVPSILLVAEETVETGL